MTALITTQFPLAQGRDGRRLDWPKDTSYLLLKRATPGRAADLHNDDGEPTTVPATADVDYVEAAVHYEPGTYLAIPHTADGKKLPSNGYVELTPESMGLGFATPTVDANAQMMPMILKEMFGLLKQSIATNEANTMMLRLAVENANQGMVGILNSHATATGALPEGCRVMTGMAAIERQEPPSVDVSVLAEKLDATIKDASKGKGASKWAPLVTAGMSMVAYDTLAAE